MKKKLMPIVLTAVMVASLTTACGGASETTAPAPAAEEKTESETSAPEETEPEADVEEEASEDTEVTDDSASEDFTLLDVTTDMIEAGVYAVSDDGTKLVFSMFNDPSGTPMASLFMFVSNGNGDVICGTYESESETDEDGITWTALTVADAYTDENFVIGFGESEEGEVYILDGETVYEGEYLSADDTINYMGAAVALLGEGASEGDASDDSASGDFTLLDVSTDMIEAGVYAVGDDGTELVFSMFTDPSGTPMASLFIFASDGSGDVICGTFDGESETDEDGITWSLMTVADAYTDEEFQIGFGETDAGEVYIIDAVGNTYEGEYLSADDTITYMGTAAALLDQ